MKDSNLTHYTVKGKIREAKQFIDYKCTCIKKCGENVSRDEKEICFKKFWNLASYDLQTGYIGATVKVMPIKRKRTKATEENNPKVSFQSYQNIFYMHFNLKRKPPIKDTCNSCDKYSAKIKNTQDENEKETFHKLHDNHLEKAEDARNQMQIDFKEATTNPTLETLSYDMEKVLGLPKLSTNIVYYKRQLESGLNKLCLNPKGQFPSKSCNKFVNCWDGIASEQECPPGLLFSSKGYCDYPENVDCNGRPQGLPPADTKPGTVTSSNAPTQVPDHSTVPVTAPTVATLPPVLVDPALQKRCLQPRGQFPSSSCKKYVNCWDGHVVEQECPEGLLFSTKGYCDYSYNVNCGDRGEKGGSKGFKFNEGLGICDYEANVDCSEKIINHSKQMFEVVTTEKNAGNNEYIAQNTKCSVEYGTFRDMYKCNKYYICADFKIVSQHECPPGFSFNDNIGKCDYSHKVDCARPQQMYEITKNSILQIPEEYREKVNNCKPGSVFRLNSECTAACLCRNGLAEVIQCPTGFAYDSAIDKCILRHLARC
ncbi:unnamed protein product [Diabrotica balteata]|uniref:Chitin-binding type-2 domain-containing protein n=1 Tax=Diabrotica balteata TaxID=107213 RepID=A0A9N9T3T3_DIABA|nr:unnamed protein product [Diabrotica balteata]